MYLQLGFTLCPPWQALSPSVHMTLNCRHVSFSHPFWRCHMLGIANVSVNTVHAPLASVGCWHVRGTAPVTVMFKRPCCRSCKDLKKICISCWWSEGYKANARSSFLLLSMFFSCLTSSIYYSSSVFTIPALVFPSQKLFLLFYVTCCNWLECR